MISGPFIMAIRVWPRSLQMRQREFGGHGVVEDEVAHAGGPGMGRDRYYRQRAEEVGMGVQQQKAVYRPLDHAARVFPDQAGVPVMAGGEVKIMSFDKGRAARRS